MYFIIDNNQLTYFNELFKEFSGIQIILPLPVYAEIVLRRNPKKSMEALQGHDLLFGMQIGDILSGIRDRSEKEICSFEPFLSMNTKEYARYLQSIFAEPTNEIISLARHIKDSNLLFCSRMRNNAVNFRKIKRDRKSSGAFKDKDRFDKMRDALESAPSFLEELIYNLITQEGKKKCTISSKAGLKDAVMSNPYLSRLFRSMLCYVFSISRMWTNQKYNYDPEEGRDDLTDILLPTYACDGDIIVTDDRKLKQHIKLLEPTGVVKGLSVHELLDN